MAEKLEQGTDRRTFVKHAGVAVLAAGMDARSYARIVGANSRIRIAQLGCGSRSHGHVHMTQLASKYMPVETVAVCDIWSHARARRAAQVKDVFNLEPQQYKYSEDMLARKDIDGVMIATGAQEDEEVIRVPGAPSPSSWGPDDDDVRHMVNWVAAMQTRKQPNATVDHGFSHSIVCIMAAQSYWSGKRLYWNQQTEEIVEQPAI